MCCVPHPMVRARELGNDLRADRVAAGQVKEHVPVQELLELLGITDEELNHEVARRYNGSADEDE